MVGKQSDKTTDELARSQEVVERLAFDLQTAQAVKNKSTEILAGLVADFIVARLDLVLNGSDVSDEQLLRRIHELRGTLRALGEIGDSVRSAHVYLAKKAVRDRMGLAPQPSQEDRA